jgi:hypothetical protein
LYGNEVELQVDISRLPRVDEYSTFSTPEGAIKMPSDVKTVAYYVRQYALAGSNSRADEIAPGLNSQGTGLVRRELPRAISKYAMDNGSSDFLLEGGDLLAPEVVGINFRYFSGQEWLTEWDSEQMEGLPVAVEIILQVRSAHAETAAARTSNDSTVGTTATLTPPLVYRLVVRIPAAQLGKVPSSGDESTAGTDSGSSATSASGASGSGTGGS